MTAWTAPRTWADDETVDAVMMNTHVRDNLNHLYESKTQPNLLVNGGFRVAQRGAGPFTSATVTPNNDDIYILDGCILLSDGNDIVDVSQVADTDFVSGYKIRLDVETANKRFGILLPIENKDIQDIRYSATASVQFKVKRTGTSMANVRAYLLSWNSTADTITSDVVSAWNAAGADPTFAANWTAENAGANLAISTTIATKQIQNIAVDTSGVTNLALFIMLDDTDASIGDFLEIGDVKVEPGIACTTYYNRPIAEERRSCQRYYSHSWEEGSLLTNLDAGGCYGIATSTSKISCFVQFNAHMRIDPAIFIYNYGSTINKVSNVENTDAIGTSVTAARATTKGLEQLTDSGTGFSAGTVYWFGYIASAEL